MNLIPTSFKMSPCKDTEMPTTEALEWAIETAPNSPHLWSHTYGSTPIKILTLMAKHEVRKRKIPVEAIKQWIEDDRSRGITDVADSERSQDHP